MTIVQAYPLIAAVAAHAMPALPVVHSMMVIPGRSSPRVSAFASM